MPVTFEAAGTVSGALFARGFGLDYGSNGPSPRLAEEPRIPPHWLAARDSLFHEGHVTAPWSIFVADSGSEVHLTTSRQESPHGAVVATATAEGIQARWSGARSGTFRISGRASDLRLKATQGATLKVRYRVDRAPQRAVTVGIQCAEPTCGARLGAMLDVTRVLKAPHSAQWQQLSIPLSCLTAAGAELAAVVAPFVIETSGRLQLTIAELSLAPDSGAPRSPCP